MLKLFSYSTVLLAGLLLSPISFGSFVQDAKKDKSPESNTKKPAVKVIQNSIGMKLAYIPPGKFLMGSPKDEKDRIGHDEFQHEVELTKDFYMGVHEVTVGQFKQFVADGYRTEAEKDGNGGSGYNEGNNELQFGKPRYTWKNTGWTQTDEHPVVNVTWNDAKAFCAWLSKREHKSYGLPSEAQWEYACRAGTKTAYQSGDDEETLAQVGNVADADCRTKLPQYDRGIEARDGYAFTAPVGKFRTNAFGLFDMHGNVWEWCEDWYDAKYYDNSPNINPLNATASQTRVLRGGSWSNRARNARSAFRLNDAPNFRSLFIGFRVVSTES